MGKKPNWTNTPEPTPALPELPERWSVLRKLEVVLRFVCGERPGRVSRETQVPAHELDGWQP